jgi:hypothetical protein
MLALQTPPSIDIAACLQRMQPQNTIKDSYFQLRENRQALKEKSRGRKILASCFLRLLPSSKGTRLGKRRKSRTKIMTDQPFFALHGSVVSAVWTIDRIVAMIAGTG